METYLARARLAEQQARNARNPEERRAFLEIVALWRGLAEREGERRAGSDADEKSAPDGS